MDRQSSRGFWKIPDRPKSKAVLGVRTVLKRIAEKGGLAENFKCGLVIQNPGILVTDSDTVKYPHETCIVDPGGLGGATASRGVGVPQGGRPGGARPQKPIGGYLEVRNHTSRCQK